MTSVERKTAEAIKQLRTHLCESQQQFSNRLGVAVRTVARYEAAKPPSGHVLLRLAQIANESGREDLRHTFLEAEEIEVSARVSPIAGAVRKLRYELGYTQQQLAEAIGLSTSAIAGAESRAYPGREVLTKLKVFAQTKGLVELEQTFSVAQDSYTAKVQAGRQAERQRAWEYRSEVFDSLQSIPGVDTENRGPMPVDLSWFLPLLLPGERETLEDLLLDLALNLLHRLEADQSAEMSSTLQEIGKKALRAKRYSRRGQTAEVVDYLHLDKIERLRHDLRFIADSLISRAPAEQLLALREMLRTLDAQITSEGVTQIEEKSLKE